MKRIGRYGYLEDNNRILMNVIYKEYELFRREMLLQSTCSIYDSCNKIQFYGCISEYFLIKAEWLEGMTDMLLKLDNPIAELWNYYILHTQYEVYNWERIEELLASYLDLHTTKEKVTV